MYFSPLPVSASQIIYLLEQTPKKTPKNRRISPIWCLSPFHAAQGSEGPPSMILLRWAFAASWIPAPPLSCHIAAVAFHRVVPLQCFPLFPSLPWILLMNLSAKFSLSSISWISTLPGSSTSAEYLKVEVIGLLDHYHKIRTSKSNSGLVSKGGVKLLVLGSTCLHWVLESRAVR